MTTSLSDGSTTVDLHDDLIWTDEFSWRGVEGVKDYTIAGALIVESAPKLSGRPISLTGGPNFAWVTRADVLALHAWSLLPDQLFTLILRGVSFSVRFDHSATPFDATPVVDFSDPDNTDYYFVRLNLIETT